MMAAPFIAGIVLPWSGWLDDHDLNERHIDPYLVWSLQTEFRQHIPPPPPHKRRTQPELVDIDFLVELCEPIRKGYPNWPSDLKASVPKIYFDDLPGGTGPARHVTVRLDVRGMGLEDMMNAVSTLMRLDGVRRSQMGFPRPPFADDKAVRPKVPRGPLRGARKRPKVVLAVLDDACPFGHPALTSNGRTRVAALWDQSLCNEKPSPRLDYGRERSDAELDCLLDQHKVGDGCDEESLYLDRNALQKPLRQRNSHAVAMVTLLAGQTSLLPAHPTSSDAPTTEAEIPALRPDTDDDDAAGEAPLVVVQFPREQIDLTARWMAVRALDGLRYVVCEAEKLKGHQGGPTLPLVANLSYGGVVGAHDGTALLETAMAELAGAHRRMAIVLAAGNAYSTRRDDGDDGDELGWQPSGCHATGVLKPNGGTVSLKLCVAANKPIETYLEMWFEDIHKQPGDEQFLENHEVSIEAVPPIGKPLTIDIPDARFDHRDSKKTGAGLIGLRRVAQSLRRSMALLVVAATQVSSKRVEVPSGIWHIRLTNRGKRCLRLAAWVERDLLPGFARASQAARLLKSHEDDALPLSDDDTLNNIATGEQVFRVGALTWRGRPVGLTVSAYSSAARNDAVGPEFSAVADEAPSLPGIRVSGSIGSAIVRMNGTSVAAPQAARYIANRLARGHTLEQIRADLGHAHGDRRRGRILV
jgi:hypothetical protein